MADGWIIAIMAAALLSCATAGSKVRAQPPDSFWELQPVETYWEMEPVWFGGDYLAPFDFGDARNGVLHAVGRATPVRPGHKAA